MSVDRSEFFFGFFFGVARRTGKHDSWSTEKSYLDWIRRSIRFRGIHRPAEMGAAEVEALLTHLAFDGRIAAIAEVRRSQRNRARYEVGSNSHAGRSVLALSDRGR